jgi:hypothetical protein
MALFLGDAPHKDTVGATAVEIPFYRRVAFSQPYYALCGDMVFGKDILLQVVPDLEDPCIETTLSFSCGVGGSVKPPSAHTTFGGSWDATGTAGFEVPVSPPLAQFGRLGGGSQQSPFEGALRLGCLS